MALIAVTTAGRVEVVGIPETQKTLVAAEAILAGGAVRIDTTTGKFTNSNGTTAPEARIYGIATKSVAAGEPVTAIRKGELDGFTFSQAYDAAIYLSDTDGRLGDAAGTVSVIVGRVVPTTGEPLGTANDKILFVDL
jgi:hypothetical protein